MCLAVPGKVISIDDANPNGPKMAKCDFAGVIQNICIDWLPEIQVGEYVMVHVGFALNKIDEEDAEETIRLLRQMGELPE
jgi:hydrogenase expression/formation protein HypC